MNSDAALFVMETNVLPQAANPSSLCLHQFFELQAAQTPDATALVFGHERVTYRQLNERANQLAHRLQRHGVKPDSLVGLSLERSCDMIVGLLAILKAGGAYVPIEPLNPTERITFILEDARTPILLTESKFMEKFAGVAPCIIALDHERDTLARESVANPTCATTGDNFAYVIYTSGSTGQPKGVLVTHDNVVRLFSSTDQWFQFDHSDVWTLFHSFAFDFSVWEIWGALIYGGRLVVVPQMVARSPESFYQLLATEKVTVLNQTPSAFRQLIWAENNSAAPLPLALRYVVFGGEALELQSLKPWFDHHGDATPKLINMYGITETTVHVTYRPISMADVAAGRGSVIGCPIPDLQVHVLDEHLKPVAVGDVGEMFVGGAGVARGYLNRPELTAQKFIENPFSSKKGERLYRSGDLARVLPDGDLEYAGRIDHQVKIRGHRIELGEIEATLNKHAAVRENITIAVAGSGGDKRLVSYVVSKDSHPSVTELRQFLAQTLPEYEIPSVFVFLEALPLTINGKVDRKALPSPDRARPEMRAPFATAVSPEEKLLVQLWSEALQIDQIGVDDNFFELGGDSIRSIQVLARAQKNGLKLSLQQLFTTPTIRELVRNQTGNEDSVEPLPLLSLVAESDRAKLPADLEDAYPAATLQTGMIFHSDYNPKSAIFHDVFSFQIKAPLHLDKLEKAVASLTERHSIFRTSFDVTHFSQPLQFVHKTVKVPLTSEDLRTENAAEQKAKLVAWVETEKRHPFNWAMPPMLRLHAQQYQDNTFQIIVSFHHCIMDGWSLAVMLTELFQDYFALLEGSAKQFTAPKVSYRDFIALEQKTIQSQTAQAFWKRKLENPTIHKLPRWPKALCRGGQEQVRGPEIYFDAALFEKLKKLANSAGVPIRTVLLSAHLRVLNYITGQEDIITGLVTNGRPQALDGDQMVGLFLNTLPLRVSCSGGTWRDLIKSTFQAEREILPYRRTPTAEVQKLTGGRTLFETTFDFVQFHVYRDLPGYAEHSFLEDYYFEANNFPFFVTFMVDITGTQLQMHFDYDPNEFGETQIKNICDYFSNTLEAMTEEPDAHYENHCPIAEQEHEQLLVNWNQTQRDYPLSPCVHQLFEAQAERTPTNTAAMYGGVKLTYQELNRHANSVARKLNERGVGPGTLVGISLERSLEMLVAVLGVLKSGGGYVPLDPHFPQERLRFMAEDAGIFVLLTQQSLQGQLEINGCEQIFVEDILTAQRGQVVNPANEIKSSSVAYTIYTSGSTGRPKGVQVPHSAVVNFLLSMQEEPGICAADSLLAVTTLSFDIAGLELFLPLTVGAKVIIAPSETALDASILSDLIQNSHATIMQATPATWRMLVECGWMGSSRLKILCGGEACSRELADRLLERGRSVWNMYGPTETTIWSCVYKIQSGTGPVPIGRPIANTEIYILNADLTPVPLGSEGELYIGGNGLALGYWQRPELTNDKFIPNHFSAKPGARLYRTGDLASYLPDGNLICTGRSDQQVKIRGFRVELGEIESVLRRHAAIAECVVVAQETKGEKNLAAYVIFKAGQQAALSELRAHIGESLPGYMIPSAFMILEKFPMTPNGKIDRKALPKPEQNFARETKYEAPATPIEKALAAIWSDVLGVERVGLEDNFFELGGHSLLAMRVVAKARETFQIDLTIASLFECPTLQDFSLLLLEEMLTQHQVKSSEVEAMAMQS